MNELSSHGLHGQQTDAIEQLSALRATVDAEILGLIRAADESEVWKVDGSPNLVEWVTWRCRVSRAEARKLVDVAQALRELPRIAAGLDDGSLSYSQVCILVDFVGPDCDAEWAERARGMHVEQLRAGGALPAGSRPRRPMRTTPGARWGGGGTATGAF